MEEDSLKKQEKGQVKKVLRAAECIIFANHKVGKGNTFSFTLLLDGTVDDSHEQEDSSY